MSSPWYDMEMPPLDLANTPEECIGELVNAIIVMAYVDYFGADPYAAEDAKEWFLSKEYTWLTLQPLELYLERLEDLGASENPKNEDGAWGREGRYQNRFFVPNVLVRRAMAKRGMRMSDLAMALLMPEDKITRLMQSEQAIEVQRAWARICMRQPYRERGKIVKYRANFEQEDWEI